MIQPYYKTFKVSETGLEQQTTMSFQVSTKTYWPKKSTVYIFIMGKMQVSENGIFAPTMSMKLLAVSWLHSLLDIFDSLDWTVIILKQLMRVLFLIQIRISLSEIKEKVFEMYINTWILAKIQEQNLLIRDIHTANNRRQWNNNWDSNVGAEGYMLLRKEQLKWQSNTSQQ